MEMSFWYQNNYFSDTLMVKRTFDKNFVSLRNLIGVYGTVHPFTVATNYFPIPNIENYFDQFHPSQSMQQQQQMVQSQMQQPANMQMPQNLNRPQMNNFTPPKLQLRQPPQINFLAQPFPTINKPPLPSSNASNFDRRMMMMQATGNKTMNFSQAAYPSLSISTNNFDMNSLSTTLPQPPAKQQQQMPQNVMFKPFNGNNQMPQFVPPPSQQQQRLMESSAKIDPIQKMLYEIQKHQQQQQQVNYLQQQKQQQPFIQNNVQTPAQQQPFANQNVPNANQVRPMQRRSQENQDLMNFDADDEGEFQRVENPRKKRFQNENEALQSSEKAKVHGSEPPKATAAAAATMKMATEPRVEEKSTQPAMPAPWFKKVVVCQNDDKSVNNIQFTFAENTANMQPVAWPKIAPIQSEEGKAGKKCAKEEEKRSNQPAMVAPWLKKSTTNQHDDEKSLKKIQIEEEKVRKVELQMRRDREKHERELKRQGELSQPRWKTTGNQDAEMTMTFNHPPPPIYGWNNDYPQPSTSSAAAASSSKKKDKANEREGDAEINWCVDSLQKLNITHVDSKKFFPTLVLLMMIFIIFCSPCIFEFFAIH